MQGKKDQVTIIFIYLKSIRAFLLAVQEGNLNFFLRYQISRYDNSPYSERFASI